MIPAVGHPPEPGIFEDDPIEPPEANPQVERRRMWTIVAFILAAMALAVVLAYWYAQPSAG
jgi:hypothetical protein